MDLRIAVMQKLVKDISCQRLKMRITSNITDIKMTAIQTLINAL